MATSGTIDFEVNAAEIVQDAIAICSARNSEIPLTNNETSDGIRALNKMVKHWQTQSIHLWKRDEGVLFLQVGKQSYDIGGATVDEACLFDDFVHTQISTAASSGANTLVVDSTTGMTASDKIGIELDDGTRQWTTIVSVDSSTGLTITATLTDDVAVDNTVFTYTTDIDRPLRVDQARRRRITDTTEVTLDEWGREDYFGQTAKASQGTPTAYFYDPRLSEGRFYVWQTASDVNQVIFFTLQRTIEDFDISTNTPDFPVEIYQLLLEF